MRYNIRLIEMRKRLEEKKILNVKEDIVFYVKLDFSINWIEYIRDYIEGSGIFDRKEKKKAKEYIENTGINSLIEDIKIYCKVDDVSPGRQEGIENSEIWQKYSNLIKNELWTLKGKGFRTTVKNSGVQTYQNINLANIINKFLKDSGLSIRVDDRGVEIANIADYFDETFNDELKSNIEKLWDIETSSFDARVACYYKKKVGDINIFEFQQLDDSSDYIKKVDPGEIEDRDRPKKKKRFSSLT